MTEARQLHRIIGDLYPDQTAAHRQAEVIGMREGIERQLTFRIAGVAIGVRQLQARRDGKEKTGIEGMRNADQIAQIHGLGYALNPNSKIPSQTPPSDPACAPAALGVRLAWPPTLPSPPADAGGIC